MRLDKFLCDLQLGTRSQVKEYIKKGNITVNNVIIKKPDYTSAEIEALLKNRILQLRKWANHYVGYLSN